MRKLLLIGIGMGGPEQLSVLAIEALRRVDVFFVVDKGAAGRELVELRRQICSRYLEPGGYRVVEVPDPERDREAPAYREAVEDWTQRRADVCGRAFLEHLPDGGCGAILVWGDPAFYDGALRVVELVATGGAVPLDVEVIPGVSSIQALAARHRIALTRVGRPLLVTTGRRLSAGFPAGVDDVVVMLDGRCAFADVPAEGIDIYWGAYLGTEDELLVSGPVGEVAEEIVSLRREARERKGWVMDVYLLRRSLRGDLPEGRRGERPAEAAG